MAADILELRLTESHIERLGDLEDENPEIRSQIAEQVGQMIDDAWRNATME